MYSDLRSRKARWASLEPEFGLFMVVEVEVEVEVELEGIPPTPSPFPLFPFDTATAAVLLDFLPGLAR